MARRPGREGSDPPRGGHGEATQPMASPLGPVLVGHVFETMGQEAEAAREARDVELAADIEIRLALLAWDVFGDAGGAVRHLSSAQSHPLAALLAIDAALAAGDPEAFEVASAQNPPTTARAALELAETWLYRLGECAPAHEAARRGLDLAADSPLAETLFELSCLALGCAGDWEPLAAQLASHAHRVPALAEAAHVLNDRLIDRGRAAELIAVCAGAEPGRPEAAFHLTLLAADVADSPAELAEALERRLELIGDDPEAAAEHSATAFMLTDPALGFEAHAPPNLLPESVDPLHGSRLAMIARARFAQRGRDWPDAAAALEQLGLMPGAGRFAVAYLRRAAEMVDAHVGDVDRSLALWRRVAAREPGDSQATRAIERALLAGDPEVLVAHFEALAEGSPAQRTSALRRAAAVAESRLRDPARAIALGERAGLRSLGRLYRRSEDRSRLIAAYRDLAVSSADERVSSAVLCAVGALELCRGREKPGEQALVTASRLAPRDVTALTALADLYRHQGRWKDMTAMLARIAESARSPTTRLSALALLGRIRADKLDDPRRAREAFEQVLEIDPDRADVVEALARLSDREGRPHEAIELRERAAELATGTRAIGLLIEIAEIRERALDEPEAALAAYERVLEVAPDAAVALAGAARLYRNAGRYRDWEMTLDRELAVAPGPRQPELWVAKAEAALAIRRAAEEALACYQRALAIEPSFEPALEGLAQVAAPLGRWAVIADAYRSARPTATNLALLARAVAQLGNWLEYCEVRLRELDLAHTPAVRARILRELGEVYERELGDDDAAIDAYRRALEIDPGDPEARRDLARLLEEAGRWQELSEALSSEVAAVSATDSERRIELLLRLGEVLYEHLGAPERAAVVYEQVRDHFPGHPDAIGALEQIYDQLGRQTDLLNILAERADATEDRRDRAAILVRMADARSHSGDLEGAIDTYARAFASDPTDRETFRKLEKLAYQRGRWDAVTRLYAAAIDVVENRGEPVYQLADLYARRGHVELNCLGRVEAAAAAYARAVDLDPTNERAFVALESIHQQLRDWASMIRLYERRAASLGNTAVSVDMFRRAARVSGGQLKHRTQSAHFWERLLDLDPGDREARDAVERHYRSAEEWEKLIESLEARRAATEGTPAIDSIKEMARAYEDGLRDESRAVACYREVLEQVPDDREALESLSRIYESTERWDEMLEVARHLIEITEDRAVKALLHFKCGSVLETKFSREDDAIECYDAAIKESRSCLPAVHGLRDIYLRRKDWARVIQTLELEVKLWEDENERAGVYAQIGGIYAEQLGERERAMRFYESALAVDPDCLPANKALFEHYYAAGEWEKARQLGEALAQKAMRDGDPDERSAFFRRRGKVERQAGDFRAAAESLVIALEIQPGNIEALDDLGEIARDEPWSYNFPATYYELEKLYRRREQGEPLLARVRVAQAVALQRDGDLDGAEDLYRQAWTMVPGDFRVMSALVDFHVQIGEYESACEDLDQFLVHDPPVTADDRVDALMRRAEIQADGLQAPDQAMATLREVIELRAGHAEAYYQLAQQLFLLSRFDEARGAIERVIELSAQPGEELSPEKLARFYYYLGRIIERCEDSRAAAPQYRRAHEYDPTYPPPALALAWRSAETGDQRGAEDLLIASAHAAIETSGKQAAVPLQRGLARVLLAGGDREAAIQAYRGILEVEPDGGDDRCALAEVYALDDLPRAIREVKKVLARDLRHAPAYRLLASYYLRSGQPLRAARVIVAMEMMGYAEDADRTHSLKGWTGNSTSPLRRMLGDRHRALLVTGFADTPMGEVFTAIAPFLSLRFGSPGVADSVPYTSLDVPSMHHALVAEVARVFGVDAEILVARNVPRKAIVIAHPRPRIFIDAELLSATDAARRFLFGWAFDAIRGGYALLLSLGQKQRTELGALLNALLQPEGERGASAEALLASLPQSAAEVIEAYAGTPPADPEQWIDGMLASARRAGLFACDDFAAATWMLARLSEDSAGISEEETAALGAVIAGEDLIRFYLSDEYNELRRRLMRVVPDSVRVAE